MVDVKAIWPYGVLFAGFEFVAQLARFTTVIVTTTTTTRQVI